MDKLIVKGSGLTIENVVNVARNGQKVELHPDAIERINICRAMLEKKIEAKEIIIKAPTLLPKKLPPLPDKNIEYNSNINLEINLI